MECHSPITKVDVTGACSIALVGHPNVGKSDRFQRLTGQRVTVSNYPGTTVEIARAAIRGLPGAFRLGGAGRYAIPARIVLLAGRLGG